MARKGGLSMKILTISARVAHCLCPKIVTILYPLAEILIYMQELHLTTLQPQEQGAYFHHHSTVVW